MTLMEPFAPWMRDINRFIAGEAPVPAAFLPPADVIVTDQGVTVHMDVPGLRTDDLEIELENDTLTVRGERPFPYQQQDDGGQRQRVWRHIERRFGRFERSLRVPGGLDANAVEASISDGVLTMAIPRPEQPKPHRVPIRADSGDGRQTDVEGTAAQDSTAAA
jgi:HSP20 family protein